MIDKGTALFESASKTCDAISDEIRASGVAPNAACGFAKGEIVVSGGETDALFDLASLTKPVFAVSLARSGIDRQTRLGALLPEARGTPSEDVPLELLIAHRAGFPAHLPLYAPLAANARFDRSVALRSACVSRTPGPLPAPPLYSDIGYILAGAAVTPTPDEFMDEHVVSPLGLSGVLGSARMLEARGVDVRALAPPTETVAWRGGEIRGRVHDENAWALAGDGACGHAGLFGTIGAVLRFGLSVLENMKELEWLVRVREGGTLRAGFDGKSAEGSSAGSVLGPRTFGHLGFTGTSFWIDPDAGVVVALLTNRVCPTRESTGIREARPRVHDALARAALALPLFRR